MHRVKSGQTINIWTGGAALAAAVLVLSTPLQARAAGDASVRVIHGIPGQDLGLAPALPVDIEVSGSCVLSGVTFGAISTRLGLPAGSYDIRVRLSDGRCGGAVAVEALAVPFAADEKATVIAHLDASGSPTASKFTDDLSLSAPHESRVQVHHTAAAPAVDLRFVRPGVQESLDGVTNGQSGSLELGDFAHELLIAPAGGAPIFQQTIDLAERATLFAYAVGSLATGTFTVLAEIEAQPRPATVSVIHGITGQDLGLAPQLPVDIAVVGVGCVLTHFEFGDIENGLSLPADVYDIEVRLADGQCGGAVAVSASGISIFDGEDATIIAHLDANGAPTASKFSNFTGKVGRREDRVVAHHTAAAPAVDITLTRVFRRNPAIDLKGVTNGQAAGDEVRRGLYTLSVAPAGGAPIFRAFTPIFGRRSQVLIYAVGSVSTGTFQLIADRRSL